MAHWTAACRLWPLLLLSCLILPLPAVAKGGGGGDGGGSGAAADADADDDSDLDDDEVLNTGKRSKAPSHFAIKTSMRLGLRHYLDDTKAFSLEGFVRDQQGALDNPLALRSSQVSGGLVSAYRSGNTTWMVTFQTGEVFSRFYEHTTRTNYVLRTTLQQQIDIGDDGWAIVPRAQVGYQWSSDITQQRWKFQATAPVSYALSDTVTLMPLMPKLSYQPYTDRADHRADWTLQVSAGIRWSFAAPSFLQLAFGYENRWSNVHNAEFSRWVLTPQLNLRIVF